MRFYKTMGSITAIGFVIAFVAAVLYYMALPIFNSRQLAWIFFYGLIAFAIASLSMIVQAIWDNEP